MTAAPDLAFRPTAWFISTLRELALASALQWMAVPNTAEGSENDDYSLSPPQGTPHPGCLGGALSGLVGVEIFRPCRSSERCDHQRLERQRRGVATEVFRLRRWANLSSFDPSDCQYLHAAFTTSVQPSSCSLDDSEMPDAAFRDALDNFRKTNAAAWDISSLIGGGQEITKAAHDSMFNKRDAATGKSDAGAVWNEFHRRYPRAKGVLGVSAVGFDTGRTAAIVYSEVSCGALCGTGSFTYFRRTTHGWDRVEAGIPNCRWIA
jgi:hypothetical protein